MPELLDSLSSESSSRRTNRSDELDSFVITEGERDHDHGALSHQMQVTHLLEKILEVNNI